MDSSASKITPTRSYNYHFNVLVIGSTGVGKTALFKHLTLESLPPVHDQTQGVSFAAIGYQLNNTQSRLQLWDISNEEENRTKLSSYYTGANGVIIMFDITDEHSFRDVSDYAKNVKELCTPGIPVVIVGNKSDLSAQRVVPENRGFSLANSFGYEYREISVAKNIGLPQLLEYLVSQMIEGKNSSLEDKAVSKEIRLNTPDKSIASSLKYNNKSRLNREETIFLNCDITDLAKDPKYPLWKIDSVITVAQIMAKISDIMKIPILVSEQVPKVFGHTVSEIKESLPAHHVLYEKTRFSMVTEEAEQFFKENKKRKNAVLYGTEAHVCIQQTCLDLLERGYMVYVLVDGITSKREGDRTVAIKRMEQAGAILTTAESVIFELLGDAKDPLFKPCLQILKTDRTNQISTL